MSLYKQYATDSNKEVAGIRFVAGINEDDKSEITFIIARAGGSNKQFTKQLEIESKPYRAQIRTKTLPESIDRQIYVNAFVGTVLKGWENVRDANEQPLVFTKENAVKLLNDLPELYDSLVREANDVSQFREATNEEDAKN